MAANIGLGCVTFGREIDKEASFALMDHARDIGIKSFDTAAAYGNGLSETIIGEWLSDRGVKSGEISIATKILPPYHPAQVLASVEDSLRRLRVDTIDIMYLHRWDASISNDTWLMLNNLKQGGEIKAIGVSNFNTEQLSNSVNRLQDLGIQLSYIQNNHNLAVSDITPETRLLCAGNEIRIITYSPLGAGFLTGKHLNGVAQNSRFDIMPGHQDVYFNNAANKRLNKLLQVAAQTGEAPELLAMAWALHQAQTYSVLVGGRSAQQLDLVAKAMQFYSPEIFAELESV
ncbi:aldo/keto reductase [Mucilaginibacter mali]|uniref:Aldo/keto reductase n=1 Tax=Mucilaginibacter mali TaxID=2740462 RepID=A0A7D4QI85_9SPHI|nr:aldo/keto reductase [Mucilaginibacter mali]QKJ32632.1 aldo/keto reductase [Mucilaginibacter mali]